MARKGILGTKLGMTQVFDENNKVVPVTVVKAGPNVVTRIRTPEVDGYSAVQIAYGEISPRKVNKPVTGQFAVAGVNPRRHLAELRLDDEAAASEYEVGQELTAEIFVDGSFVDGPCLQGHPHVGPDGHRPDHHAEPGGAQGRCRERRAVDQGRHPRPYRRTGDGPQCHQTR
jgi:hypothetical protein